MQSLDCRRVPASSIPTTPSSRRPGGGRRRARRRRRRRDVDRRGDRARAGHGGARQALPRSVSSCPATTAAHTHPRWRAGPRPTWWHATPSRAEPSRRRRKLSTHAPSICDPDRSDLLVAAPGADQSVFERLVRFRPSPGRTPREDPVTEVFAAVLERVPGLALCLAKQWVDTDQHRAGLAEKTSATTGGAFGALQTMHGDVIPRVATQVHTLDGRRVRRVDLELRFATDPVAPSPDVLIRVEVKHGAKPQDEQLAAYVHSVPVSVQATAAVILLAPRQDLPGFLRDQVPADVAQRTWQRTALNVAAFRAPDPVHAWLVEELAAFLYQEQLMDPTVLRPEHLSALAHIKAAESGLAVICQSAADYLQAEDRLGPCDCRRWRADGRPELFRLGLPIRWQQTQRATLDAAVP